MLAIGSATCYRARTQDTRDDAEVTMDVRDSVQEAERERPDERLAGRARLARVACGVGLGLALGLGVAMAPVPVTAGVAPVGAVIARAAEGTGLTQDDPIVIDASEEAENPFPDKLTPEMIAESTHEGKGPLPELRHVRGARDEGRLRGEDALQAQRAQHAPARALRAVSRPARAHPLLRGIHAREPLLRAGFTFTVGHLSYDAWDSPNPLVSGPGNGSFQLLPTSVVRHNGKDLPAQGIYWRINYPVGATQYFEVHFDVPEGATTIVANGYPGTPDATIPPGNLFRSYRTQQPTSAIFHLVEEGAYRAACGLGSKDPILERSTGERAYSEAPFPPLDVADLAEPTVTRGSFQTAYGSMMLYGQPLLSPEGSPSKDFVYDAAADRWVYGEVKPTYAELTARTVPGYVLVGDDIDKAPHPESADANDPLKAEGQGNHYLTMARDASGKVYREKNYYLVYRSLPIPVNFTVTAAGTPVEGATYDLLAVVDGQERPVASGLTSDGAGSFSTAAKATPAYEELQAVAARDDAFDADARAWRDGDDAYLVPGDYVLRPTSAPEGYEASELRFTVAPIGVTGSEEEGYAVTPQHFDLAASVKSAPEPQPEPGVDPGSKPSTDAPSGREGGASATARGDAKPAGRRVRKRPLPDTGDATPTSAGVVATVGATALAAGAAITERVSGRRRRAR